MGELGGTQYGYDMSFDADGFPARIHIDNQNSRIRLLNYNSPADKLPALLVDLCNKHGMGKIICIVRNEDKESFVEGGYIVEGSIDGFFKGAAGFCVSFFNDGGRFFSKRTREEDKIVNKAAGVKNTFAAGNGNFEIRTATEDDAENMAVLFDEVFDTYPTPMNEPSYVRKMIDSDVLFKIAFVEGKMASVASADMDTRLLNAEITDCATLKEYRGRGLLSELVFHLEQELAKSRFITLYSLSRALSSGINIVLSKHGYEYTGRLANNCNIMGKFEDMNIWVKRISN